MTTVYESNRFAFHVSWGSILAGSAIALVTYLIFSVLGTAIGTAAVDPLQKGNPLSGFGTGAGIWLLVSTLVSLAAGAFVAGRTAPNRGGLHGLLSWALTTLLVTWLMISLASSVVGLAGSAVGKGLSLAGNGLAAAAPAVGGSVKQQLDKQGISLDWGSLENQLNTTLKQSGKAELDPSRLEQKTDQLSADGKQSAADAAADPAQAAGELKQWFERVKQSGEPALSAADKDALVNIVAARTGKSHAEAAQIVDNYAEAYQQAVQKVEKLKAQAEQKAREAADEAAKQLSRAAWGSLLMLLLGALLSAGVGRIAEATRRSVAVS
ncbi:Uncharacterised protein [Serratia entomophila]|jgi:hypothetical protein|uniref:Membrane protein, TIGR04086 family n=1 Tax=Serratia entomophila TaxID=42906 RepID=A0ABY5CNK2_9GAMM|nr:hypothetical protein [Serratia entomophila]UIW17142.1 hypothetical protein KHA73_17100 [Serratia entomophila]USU99697.1 hypothetical protein KFQ06_16790 [Serratia entomophila]CAI0698217.1 Uncharacterised protein [Serratia entomophila]CAI0698655.1 Uncharacterised protein [Serratia entomophila]CAI0698927.1 Uncharacterised protein [Serratia entomophila]